MQKSFFKKIRIFAWVLSLGIVLVAFLNNGIRLSIINSYLNFSEKISNIFGIDKKDTISNEEYLSRLEILESQNKILESENKRLQDEQNFKQTTTYSEPLKLLGEISKIYGAMHISKPKSIQVYEGKYIYGPDGVVIGSIMAVNSENLKVGLFGQLEPFIAQVVEKDESIQLVSSGLGLYRGEVPKSSELSIGMTVQTRGYPKAALGTISQIDENQTSVNTVWVRAPYDFSKLDIFYVQAE